MKVKIAFMHKAGDLRVEEVDIPALKPNQVLLKVGACGICGSDVECFEGKSLTSFPTSTTLPPHSCPGV